MTKTESLPTYVDIALKAGVSTKTVCNVIRYPEIVRKKTGDKVLQALRELGVEDLGAMKARLRPTRSSQSKSLLFLETGISAAAWSSPVYAKIILAAQSHAHEEGWQFSLHHKKETESLAAALRNFKGEGVVLFGKATLFKELSAAIPSVAAVRLLEPPDGGADCDNVDYDRPEVSRLAAQHLRTLGCKKVAFIGIPSVRRTAFLESAAQCQLNLIDGTTDGLFEMNNSGQVVNRLALQKAWRKIAARNPEGIFVHSDQIANALYSVLAETGVRPQRDVHIVSCNAEELFLSPLHPRPATIDIHSGEIGRRGVDLLISRIRHREAPPISVIIRPKLIPGESVH